MDTLKFYKLVCDLCQAEELAPTSKGWHEVQVYVTDMDTCRNGATGKAHVCPGCSIEIPKEQDSERPIKAEEASLIKKILSKARRIYALDK